MCYIENVGRCFLVWWRLGWQDQIAHERGSQHNQKQNRKAKPNKNGESKKDEEQN